MRIHAKLFSSIRSKSTWIKPTGYDTGINLYNCIVREKVPLITKQKGVLTWYTCGPTVYDETHIGHVSCYLKIDIIQRILTKYFNFNIISAMNITDIDDKIIKRAKELKQPINDISKIYEDSFWADLGKFDVKKPDVILKVTENMEDIKSFIGRLMETEKAYEKDGSVLFNVKEHANYGKLVNVKQNDESEGQVLTDCVLWKSNKAGEPFWDSPWGDGRPGWHVECSVLASKVFGMSNSFQTL